MTQPSPRGHALKRCLSGLLLAMSALTSATSGELDRVTEAVPFTGRSSALAPGWQRGAFMQVYVRGYQDSNGDGIGDLRGLIQRLDYLKSLGVTGLWLMPVTRSQDQDHGYAVTDYRDIDPDYGSLTDFDELLAQAHARGIGVIIDYVINHSAADHPLFESARSARNSPYRDWYLWQDEVPSGWNIYGKNPWHQDEHGAYFAGFWDQMPDFNLRNTAVIAWHYDNLRFWLNRGVDGFRFDAVGNLVEDGPLAWEGHDENHGIMSGVRQLVEGYDNRFIICEAPGDPQAYARPDSCGNSFAFGHNHRIVGAALGDPSAIEKVAHYFLKAPVGMASFTSNHDAFAGQRLWDRVRGHQARYRLAAATYLLQPSAAPFIYYGEEIGMAGAAGIGGDHKLRTPMSWTADTGAGFTDVEPFRALSANHEQQNAWLQSSDPDSIWSFYRDMIALRKSRSALLEGSYAAVQQDGWQMSFQRHAGGQAVVVAFNYHDEAKRWKLERLPAGTRLKRLWPRYDETLQANAHGEAELILPGTSFAVFDLEQP
jgi:alpha-amylase